MASLGQMHGYEMERLGAAVLASTVRVTSRRHGSGSGVLLGPDTVVTNAHVATRPEVEIVFDDGTAARGEVIARKPGVDLALIRAQAHGRVPLELRSTPMRPGDLVLSAGNPWGFGPAVAIGVIHEGGHRGPVISADVRLAPGYSGGPMVDTQGRLVGINSMISGGLAIAISAETVGEFLASSRRQRLGIEVRAVPLGEQKQEAAVVTRVLEDSLGESAGLIVGDLIVGLDSGPALDLRSLRFAIETSDPIRLHVLRAGREHVVEIRQDPEHSPLPRAA